MKMRVGQLYVSNQLRNIRHKLVDIGADPKITSVR